MVAVFGLAAGSLLAFILVRLNARFRFDRMLTAQLGELQGTTRRSRRSDDLPERRSKRKSEKRRSKQRYAKVDPEAAALYDERDDDDDGHSQAPLRHPEPEPYDGDAPDDGDHEEEGEERGPNDGPAWEE